MRNTTLRWYDIVTAIAFAISLIVIQRPATAEQERSNNWRVSPRLARIDNPITAEASSVAMGKNLYLRECQQCHGQTGKGDGPVAAALGNTVANLTSPEVLNQSDGAIYTKIRTGRSPMPSFKNHLAKEEIWHLINFIRYEFDPKRISSDADHTMVANANSTSGDKSHEELFKKAEFPSAQECGACHLQIYREWSVSRHAFAQISPTFLAYQATLVKLTKGTMGDFCERCHTQVGMFTGEPIRTSNETVRRWL